MAHAKPEKILPVILCGGSGSRLWPLSRLYTPKQFLRLLGTRSLLQETLLRTAALPETLAPLIVCNQQYRFTVQDHMQEIGITPSAILLEPASRNTGPAIAVAVAWALEHHPDAVLLILPSDHSIEDEMAFSRVVTEATLQAQSQKLVTFGIKPTHAESHYGYIKASPTGGVIERFVEKPDASSLKKMQGEQSWFWNGGMFCFTPQAAMEAFKEYAPDLLDAIETVKQAHPELDGLLLAKSFLKLPSIAFDRAVMEKTTNGWVVPLAAGWSDMGSWHSVWRKKSGEKGNACQGEVLVHDTENCLLHGGKRLLAVAGLRDLVVVDSGDAVLVAHRDSAHMAGEFARTLLEQKKPEALQHPYEQRPWGTFQCIDSSTHFKVKRLSVNVGGKLSLQMHRHRAEHWVVVSGRARVTCGEKIFELTANQSTYIPVGFVHRLENVGDDPLEIIEVQTGMLCEESDIVRFDEAAV